MESISRCKVVEMMKKKPCTCQAYPFPHRLKGGKCTGQTCSKCGYPCGRVEVQKSEPYEFWGERGTHTRHYDVSDCCGE